MSFARYADAVTLAGRVLLAVIFAVSGMMKLAAPTATATYIASHGLPVPLAAGLLAGLLELAGGVLLAVGFQTRWAALVLAAFLVPVTAIFHNPLGLSGAEAQLQIAQVLKNLAIMGGLLFVAGTGPGPFSLEARAGSPARASDTPAPATRAA